MKFLTYLTVLTSVSAHVINGISSIKSQLSKRSEIDLVNLIFDNLSYRDQDFINKQLKSLQQFNGTECEACKNKIKHARELYDEDPENQHLIAMTLFQYCLSLNKNDPTKCDTVDFFLTTQPKSITVPRELAESGFGEQTSVNLFDNDFMQMLKRFNVSSDLDLEYFCFYKGDGACDLPETLDIDRYGDLFNWPQKESKHYGEPDYGTGDRETFNVLHITDFHSQLRYTVGSEGNCTGKLCCLPESFNKNLPDYQKYNFTESFEALAPNNELDFPFYPDSRYENGDFIQGEYYDLPASRGWDSAVNPAGTWGAYGCDSPVVLVNNTMKYILGMNDKRFEFSLFTGDLVDHDKIHCTPNVTKEAELLGFKVMKHYLKDIPVYPSLGNHDTFPYGQLAPRKFDTANEYQYNAELMSEIWVNDGWLNKLEQNSVKEHYAGFSHVTKRGLKIISLNSNAYYQKNLWNYIDLENDPDRFGQWEWLIEELVESESKGQRVWILAHIPSSDFDTLPIQSRIFAKIVERFSPYTIASIFYGHVHKDQFKIFFAANSTEAINMAWLGQSVTPADNLNPAFKFYEVEDKSFNVINSFNYYTRLNDTLTTGSQEPTWHFEYSARDTYDPEHKWPENAPLNGTFWNEYVLKGLSDKSNIELNQLYADLQQRYNPLTINCDNNGTVSNECYVNNYCASSNYLSEEYIKCENENSD